MARALILIGITALACRGKAPPKPATPGSAAAAAAPRPASQAPAIRSTTDRPALAPPVAPGSGAITDRFAAQQVDDAWREKTEAELERRYTKMQHPPTDTECKADMCQLTLTGAPEDLAAAIDELQALSDTSQSLLLTRPAPGKVVAYLVFDRGNPPPP